MSVIKRWRVYGTHAPAERVEARMLQICRAKHGGELLRAFKSLEKRNSMRNSVYWVRCWHVQYQVPVTGEIAWQVLRWEEQRGKWKLFACNWDRSAPKAFELTFAGDPK